MIIDTNGFDGVIFVPYSEPSGFIPLEYRFSQPLDAEIIIIGERIVFRWENRHISLFAKSCFYTQSDCQLECDRLNGISHD